jgi:hypothetical protein
MDYMVRFIGHVDERKRPENFPREIYSDLIVRVRDEKDLKSSINAQSVIFITSQCMIVPKDPDAIQDTSKPVHDTRMIVPLHMLTHISTITTRILGEIPEINLEGYLQMPDGTKAQVN